MDQKFISFIHDLLFFCYSFLSILWLYSEHTVSLLYSRYKVILSVFLHQLPILLCFLSLSLIVDVVVASICLPPRNLVVARERAKTATVDPSGNWRHTAMFHDATAFAASQQQHRRMRLVEVER